MRATRARYAFAPLLTALAVGACSSGETDGTDISAPGSATSTTTPSSSTSSGSTTSTTSPSTTTSAPVPDRSATVATGLDVPWGIAFLPDGSALVTERDEARIVHVREGADPQPLGQVPGVQPGGESTLR